MKQLKKTAIVPLAAAGLGGIALVLRTMLYALAVDEKNLLVANHPLEIALWILTGAALLLILTAVWKLDGPAGYEENFAPSLPAFVGHTAAAAGVLINVLCNAPIMAGFLGTLWKILGYLSPVCLLLAGVARFQGKKPFFLLHVLPCLFFAVHVVDHYQVWCSNPQLQDYVFALLGTIALSLFGFYLSAFEADLGKRRMLLGMGLAAVYLCTAELAATAYPYLYLGGILWALTGLCHLQPAAATPRKEE